MRNIFLFLLSCCFFSASLLAESPTASVVKLLNSRSAISTKIYVESAKELLEKARDPGERNALFYAYVIAIFADDPIIKRNLNLTDDEIAYYLEKGREWIRPLAGDVVGEDEASSNTLAQYLYAMDEMNQAEKLKNAGKTAESNKKLAHSLSLLRAASDGGNVQAMNMYGTFRLNKISSDALAGREEFDKIAKECFELFERASTCEENGKKDGNGNYNLGLCYMNGLGCDRDVHEAYKHFRIAAQSSHPGAFNNLGGFYRDGILGEKDLETAFKMFVHAHELGNAYGTLNVALAYQRGEGVEKDAEKAAKLFKNAALDGNVEARNAYGRCLYDGDGVAQNHREAVMWFRSAAKAGSVFAMENLAVCYARGHGVPQDAKESLVWRIRARAMQGDRNAVVWLSQNGYDLGVQ